MLKDKKLKRRLSEGDSDALCEVYDMYADELFTLACVLLNDRLKAEDILQDVFVRFARSVKRLRIRGKIKNYLCTCIANRCRDEFRKKKLVTVDISDMDIEAVKGFNPAENAAKSEQVMMLLKNLAKLPDKQREVIVLRIKGGMSLRKIAKSRGISVNTVMGRYRYGMNKLRSMFNGELER